MIVMINVSGGSYDSDDCQWRLVYLSLLLPNGVLRVAEPSPLYDNNHYHEECLRCNSCGLNLTGPNQKRARRFKNHILCDLHFADVEIGRAHV
jgi:hypothetical protein